MGRSKNIWNAYKMYCETGYQERNGTIVCKTVESLGFNREEIYFRKPEFVSEHQGRSAFLLGLILMYNPEITDPKMWFSQLMFNLCHDVGEIVYGDQLDDDNYSSDLTRKQIREVEAETTDELFCYFPSPWGSQMVAMRPEFEDYSGDEALLNKMVEKADAILFQLFLYTKGTTGDIKRKEPQPSRRDLRLAKILGTSKAIDVWTLHYRIATQHAPEIYSKPIRKVLEAAFKETYGYLPECMSIDASNIDLDGNIQSIS